MIIADKLPLPDDPTPSDSPPSYESAAGSGSSSPQSRNEKIGAPISIDVASSYTGASSLTPAPIIKSPSSASGKGKARASTSWFNFTASRTSREVKSTVLGLVRDLVREPTPHNAAALAILESCAEACAGYDTPFQTILQEKSIEGHTPMYWAIVKRPPEEEEERAQTPDLLTALISYASPLDPKTISDIRHACLLTSDQPLFQRLRMSPEFSPLSGSDEMLLGRSIQPDAISVENVAGGEEGEGAFVVDLEIVQFQKRMLVSKMIEVEFIARARMWRLQFSIFSSTLPNHHRRGDPQPYEGSWIISLSLLENSPPTWVDSRLIVTDPNFPSPPISSRSPAPSSSPPPAPSPSLMDRVRSAPTKPKPKPTISVRLKSAQQLVGPPQNRRLNPQQCAEVVASFEDSPGGGGIMYSGTSYIAPDEVLRARLEARLGPPDRDAECVIC